YWGARTAADLYEDAWLRELAATRPGFDYRPVLSEPREADRWSGRSGFVHEAALSDLQEPPAAFDVYASGPPALIEAVRRDFTLRGLPREQLFFDSFDYAPDTLEAMRDAGRPG
ncbi:MAG: CDP-6-deoxy-delta-3,4-glucoseen reductase, partial [Steroidobacteraceae bacterium]